MNTQLTTEYDNAIISLSSFLLVRTIWLKMLFIGIAAFSPVSFLWFNHEISWKIVLSCIFAAACISFSAFLQQRTIDAMLTTITTENNKNND